MVRRGNLFDESKIIKKEDIISNETIKSEQPSVEQVPVSINNTIGNIKSNERRTTVKQPVIETIEQNVNKETIIKNSFPVFNLEQNKRTGKIENSSISRECNVKVDIPRDQLRLIKVNNDKYINEMKLEIAILDSLLLSRTDENYEFYKNKYEYLSKELIFLNKKKSILNKLLEG